MCHSWTLMFLIGDHWKRRNSVDNIISDGAQTGNVQNSNSKIKE